MQVRKKKRRKTCCFCCPIRFKCFGKPAKIRNQNLKITKEFPRQPHKLRDVNTLIVNLCNHSNPKLFYFRFCVLTSSSKCSVYKIRKESKYPSLRDHKIATSREKEDINMRRRQMYPPVYVHYQPMQDGRWP